MSNPTALAPVDKVAQERAEFAQCDEIKITRVANGFVLQGAAPRGRMDWPVQVAYDAADLAVLVKKWGNRDST